MTLGDDILVERSILGGAITEGETHIDVGDGVPIIGLCGARPNGHDSFIYCYRGDVMPKGITCPRCVRLAQNYCRG